MSSNHPVSINPIIFYKDIIKLDNTNINNIKHIDNLDNLDNMALGIKAPSVALYNSVMLAIAKYQILLFTYPLSHKDSACLKQLHRRLHRLIIVTPHGFRFL